MVHVQLLDLFNARLFVIDKDLEIYVAEQIKVYLITIVADGHHKSTILIKKIDLLRKR